MRQPDDTVPVAEARAKWKEAAGAPATPVAPAGPAAPLERFSPEVQQAVQEMLGSGIKSEPAPLPSDAEIARILQEKQKGDRAFYERMRDENLQDLRGGGLSGDMLKEQAELIRQRFVTSMENLPRSAVTELSMHYAEQNGLPPNEAWARAKADYARLTGDTRPIPGLHEGAGVRAALHFEEPAPPHTSSATSGPKLKGRGGLVTTAALALGTGLVVGLATRDAKAGVHATLESANPLQGAVDKAIEQKGVTLDVATVASENIAGAAGAGAGAIAGAQAGAAVGSVAGPVGTVVGGAAGAVVGGLLGEAVVNKAIQGGREYYDSAVNLTSRAMESVAGVFNRLGSKSPPPVPVSPYAGMSRADSRPVVTGSTPVRPPIQQNHPAGP